MNLQKKVIHRYKEIYPNDRLRDISNRTGIQLTRVYRLLNGKDMKVAELEIFNQVIQENLKNNDQHERLIQALEKALTVQSSEELDKILDWIERKNSIKSYARFYLLQNSNNQHTA